MDTVVTTAKNAWSSERLVYREAETKDPGLQAWFHEHMVNEPDTAALAAGILLKPRDKSLSTSMLLDSFPSALLGALIYLPFAAEVGEEASTSSSSLSSSSAMTETASAQENKTTTTTTQQRKDTLIGFVLLQPLSASAPQNRSSEISISVARGYRGRGYGAEAMQWAVDWGFRFANLHRISLITMSYNERAVALYKRLGFVEEGRGRQAVYFDRRWYDNVRMAILEHEWEALRDKKGERGRCEMELAMG